jgi:hypothetical protein
MSLEKEQADCASPVHNTPPPFPRILPSGILVTSVQVEVFAMNRFPIQVALKTSKYPAFLINFRNKAASLTRNN